jgi:hypothetical protein
MKSIAAVIVLSLSMPALALAERPLKNVTITTPEAHAQPLAPAKAPVRAAEAPENSSWSHASPNHSLNNMQAGRWLTDASIAFSQNWFGYSDYFLLQLSSSLQRFITDRWALGLKFDLFHTGNYTNVYVGPITTYYFYVEDRVGAYVDTSLTAEIIEHGSNAFSWYAGAGVRYFITPAVAFGPELYYDHRFRSGGSRDSNHLGALATFALHL